MNKLNTARRAQIIACLCEGMSVRATCRITGADKKTVLRLLASVGEACLEHHDKTVRGLKSKRIQADELWSFCYAKEKNVPQEKRGTFGYGDVWTWTAMDADSKLMVSWFVGGRDAGAAFELMSDCAARLANRVQLTTDGHKAYLSAVEDVFGIGIDYAQLVKVFGENTEQRTGSIPRLSASVPREACRHRRPREKIHLHQLRGALEPVRPDAHAPVHSSDQRLLEEGREPRPCRGALLHLLQLLPRPPNAARHASDGSRNQ